jgi:parvulin-like peptidyl-prolyl isomerase
VEVILQYADKAQCEKHSRKEEALAKLKDGVKFDEVAKEFSEDKARQGEMHHKLGDVLVCRST